MAVSKVSELTALTSADAGDELLITDVSASQSKKITKANLLGNVAKTPTFPSTIPDDTEQQYVLKLTDVAGTETLSWSSFSVTETDPVVGAVTGIVKADGAGNISAAVAGTDYLASYTETDPVVGAVTGIVKADGAGNISAAVAGTDYLASYTETDPVVGAITGAVKADGAGNISAAGIVDLSDVYSSMSPTDGQVLTYDTTNGWQAESIDALPDQTDNSGKYLTTDGTDASWATLDTDANTTTKGLYEMANTISANYTISSGNNAISAGPITIDSGVSVTVPSGSVWTVV